jgi:hypothetical protein
MELINRRNMLRSAAMFTAGGATLGMLGCTNGAIDPAAVAAALKGLCGIAVPAATIVTLINSVAGATVESVVALICSGYHSSVAAQTAAGVLKGPLASGTTVNFVVIAGGKQVPVTATVL